MLAGLAAMLSVSCAEQTASAPAVQLTVEMMETPAPATSEGPNLAVSADGSAYLSWMQPGEDGAPSLRYSRLADGAWSAAVTVVTNEDLLVNWADFPSLLPTRSGRLVAQWLQKSGDGPYTYDVRVAQSVDGGASWSPGVVLHDDGVQAEHGFVSMLEPVSGDVQAIWLDGRNTVAPNATPEMQLGFTSISPEGAPGATQLIDTRICDCCQTSAALTEAGAVVVYRDRSAEEIRDISIVRQIDGAWTAPKSVHADNWHIEGCPVNGPSVAARGKTVAVAWFTGAGDREQVKVALSQDNGATFGAPVQVDGGNPAGRVSIALSASGEAHVLWLERGEQERGEIRLRTVAADGAMSEPVVVTETSTARASGFPRMAVVGEDLVIAWTEVAGQTRVRVARVTPGK
jgi:hypothetical protein